MNIMSKTDVPHESLQTKLAVMWMVAENSSYNTTKSENDLLSGYVLIRTIKGEGILFTKTKEYILTANSVLLIKFSSIKHYRTMNDCWDFYWFEFSNSIELENIFMKNIAFSDYEQDVAMEIFTSLNSKNVTLASTAFSYLLSRYITHIEKFKLQDTRIIEIVEYIDLTPLNKNISILEICKKFAMSERNLHKRFVKHSGISIKKYIINKKLEASKHLLVTTDIKIYELSMKLGYQSEYYFSKTFKNHTGLSPNNFRKRITHMI